MTFKEEKELIESIEKKLMDKFDTLFVKENLMIGREETVHTTLLEAFSQLRTKGKLL